MSNQTAGSLVVVVGPSGVGKDSVLAASQQRFSTTEDVRFVQRIITRPATAGFEDHIALDEKAFLAHEKAGDYCLSWQAHGLHYGVPVRVVDWVSDGKTVLLNGSRGALPVIRRVFPMARVAHLLVDDGVLAGRLAARGRENTRDIERRLSRQIDVSIRDSLDIVIHNNSALSDAVKSFIAFVEDVRSGHADK